MSMPEGTWVAGGYEIPRPQLAPEAVRVFVAEDSETKRNAVVASLTEFGLANHLVMATGYEEAEEFMREQTPGQLASDVFLLDGELDGSRHGGQRQGNELTHMLFSKYTDPLFNRLAVATEALKKEGLTRRQINEILQQEAVYSVAAQRLRKEALLVGISRTVKGNLGYPAQVAFAPYHAVGKVVFEQVVPEATRNRIAKQQRREADRARSLTSR